MQHLAKARDIIENGRSVRRSAGSSGYSSGDLKDSEVNDKTSALYKQSLEKHTVMPVLDSSLSYSSSQLGILRKKRALQQRLKAYNSKTPFSHDTDKMLMSRDIPNFKDEMITSRNSAYKAMNPFNVVAKNGKRATSGYPFQSQLSTPMMAAQALSVPGRAAR